MSDGDKPLNGRFTVIMHVIQLIVLVAGGFGAFYALKSDVRSVTEHVAMLQETVDKLTDFVGVWRPRSSWADDEP